MTSLIDSNILIEAKNHYYKFIICPGFWDFLEEQLYAERMLILDRVRNEITAGNDELSDWIKKFPKGSPFIKNTQNDKNILDVYNEVAEYANRNYSKEVDKFLSGADAWLIAYAREHANITILTKEGKDNLNEPKIPDVCKHFKVKCRIGIFDTLQDLGAKFVLAKPPSR